MRSEKTTPGRACIFLSRTCGVFSAIIVLLCGFITLIPLPSTLAGNITRCIPTGLLIIVAGIIMFFLEATVLGYFIEKMSFLVTLSKYINNWIRFVLYLIFSIVPLILWCLSASTIVCLGLFFTVASLNFVLAIGTRGDTGGIHPRVTWSNLDDVEGADDEDEEEEEEESTTTSVTAQDEEEN